jgi:dTDP-4-dehydrorhamnose 3,5-epimerase
MKFIKQSLAGVVLMLPDVFQDNRGAFRRNFCTRQLAEVGIEFTVCQGNISENPSQHTMRGFHYQRSPSTESKILTPVSGCLHNVVVDLRPLSDTFLKWVAVSVSAARRESLHVPAGCANAFLTTEANTIVQYYMGDFFRPETYAGFRYNDPHFNVEWPNEPLLISNRDASFPDFSVEQL